MKKIRILTEQVTSPDGNETRSRGIFSDAISGIKSTSLEVDADTLAQEIKDVYKTIADALSELRDINKEVELKEMQFTIGFDTTGQVSLFSSVSGSNTTKTGIIFTLSFRR